MKKLYWALLIFCCMFLVWTWYCYGELEELLLEVKDTETPFREGFKTGFEMGMNAEARYYSFPELGEREGWETAYKKALTLYPQYQD